MVLLLFLLAASPLVYHWLDHTLAFYVIRPSNAIPWLISTESEISYYVSKNNESRDIFLSDLKRGVNNMKILVEKYPFSTNPSIKSFYITGDSGDVCWLGYNLEPPHVEGQFGLDRMSPYHKESIEKKRKIHEHFLYGSSSIDSPPASDDNRYRFKASDSVVWIRAVDLETELKKSVSEKEPDHDEQVF